MEKYSQQYLTRLDPENLETLPSKGSLSRKRIPSDIRKRWYSHQSLLETIWSIEPKRLKQNVGKSFSLYYSYVCKKYRKYRHEFEKFFERQFHPEPWRIRYGDYFYIDSEDRIQLFERPPRKFRSFKPKLSAEEIKQLKREAKQRKALYPKGTSKTREEWDMYLKQQKLQAKWQKKQHQIQKKTGLILEIPL